MSHWLRWSDGRALRLQPRDALLVRAHLRRPDSGAGARLAADRLRRAHADPGPDRLGQDAGGAFLYGLDRLLEEPGEGTRLVYVSPLKALNYDIERNLRGPLAGLQADVSVAVRTGDTPQKERAAMLRRPPDLLITTPESLFLMLTSRARETLTGVRTLILDEVHAVAGTKRGAHLALSVERLERLTGEPFQRIGLSATQRPMEEIGKFVSGGRPIELVDAGRSKELDVEVVVPLEDMREPGVNAEITDLLGTGGESRGQSIWPSIYPRLLELVEAPLDHRLRQQPPAGRAAGAAAQRAEEIARAHHGSLAREQRLEVEELLKRGQIPCLVATSSLELGIDMGAVDLVVQVESPKSVARGLQRIGRAGHDLASVSKGRVFPKFRADLLESAVVVRRMKEGAIEETQIPRNPLDVLGQQIVAIASQEEIEVDELLRLVNRAYPFADLSRVQLENVLDMLAGRYPSDEFAELRPRIVWDRTAGVVRAGRGRPPRGHQRRDDPRPRAVRRPPRRRRRPGRRARRGDGLRGARRSDVHARRLHLADRGDHARPRPRLAGAGCSGAIPFWKGEGQAGRTSSARRSARPRASWRPSRTSRRASGSGPTSLDEPGGED